jgi:glyoxylate/hydroxypyruvate reductase A
MHAPLEKKAELRGILRKLENMSILCIFENKNVAPWKKALIEKLPAAIIEVYPNVKDPGAVDFVICWKPKNKVFEQFPNIKVVQSVGASIAHITASQTLNTDPIITRVVDEKLSNDMWEFLISVVLSELKNMRTYTAQQAAGIWQQQRYQSIQNTTVSILGLGSIGGFVAEKFAQMGFHVKGWSTSKKELLKVQSYAGEHAFDAFLKNTDFLINLLPLTESTKNILNKAVFQKLPKNAFLINVGSGAHVVAEDLIDQLDSNQLAGAFLDVFREEPLPKAHPFWKHPKIQITPHVASLTNVDSATDQISENYRRFLKKEALLNRVSLDKGY